jgi:hypothetical protein
MDDARAIAQEAKCSKKWPLGWKRWSESWTAYRGPLARRVDPTDFARLAKAYERMYELEHGLETGDRDASTRDIRFFDDVLSDIEPARRMLERLPPSGSGRRGRI